MMVRDRIQKIFANKAFYIIFSLLASITIWLYVAYIENPDVPVNVRGISVQLLNEDYLADRGLVITKVDTDSLTLRFNGRRNTVTKLSTSNLSATADLSDIKTTGIFQLQYDVIYPIDINKAAVSITGRSVNFITVSVDYLVKKDIPVHGTYNGGVAEGYQAEPMELNPNTITVSGPQEILSKISYALVAVKRDNISKTVEDSLPFTLMDDSGGVIISDKLSYSQDAIKVTIPIVMIKDVPLTVTLVPGSGASEANSVITISPATITLSGDTATLSGLNQIVLGTVDLTKFMTTTTQSFPIILPNNTSNLTGTTDASVTVTISGLESKPVKTSSIDVINVPKGYSANIITKNLDVMLRGAGDELFKIQPANIRVVADLNELSATTGTYSVIAKVNIDGDFKTIGAIGEYKVTIKLTKG